MDVVGPSLQFIQGLLGLGIAPEIHQRVADKDQTVVLLGIAGVHAARQAKRLRKLVVDVEERTTLQRGWHATRVELLKEAIKGAAACLAAASPEHWAARCRETPPPCPCCRP